MVFEHTVGPLSARKAVPTLRAYGDLWLETRRTRGRELRPTTRQQAMYSAAGAATSTPPGKILLRLFVHFHGDKIILLLHGYNKGKDSSSTRQNKEIKEAHKRLRAWKAARAKNRKR